MSDASKNVAENVPRLILFAMLASVSFVPFQKFCQLAVSEVGPRQFALEESFRPFLPRGGRLSDLSALLVVKVCREGLGTDRADGGERCLNESY